MIRKTIALFGGSFNPPHDGHMDVIRFIHQELQADEIWINLSTNRLKDASVYAPMEDRMEMIRILARHYPDLPFRLTDIEDSLGTNETYYVLKALQKMYPDDRFIWVMGSDNLANFDQWVEGEKIFEEFSVAIINRHTAADELQTPIIQKVAQQRTEDPASILTGPPSWVWLDDPEIEIHSSTALLEEIRAGKTDFDGHFNEIAQYIRDKGLYGIKGPSGPKPPNPPSL